MFQHRALPQYLVRMEGSDGNIDPLNVPLLWGKHTLDCVRVSTHYDTQ